MLDMVGLGYLFRKPTQQGYQTMATDNKDLMTQLQDLQNEYEKKAKKIGKPAFVEMASAIFDAEPKLGAIAWTQYAPHFNDGEACTFSVHGAGYWSQQAVDDGEVQDYCDDADLYCGYGESKMTAKATKLAKEFSNFIQSELGEDLCERVFGECAKVVITRDGQIDINEVDHD
jgi:hypothetical protein